MQKTHSLRWLSSWLAIWLVVAVTTAWAGDDRLASNVADALESFKAKDTGITKLLKDAHGYALFPRVGKGGMGIGGARGHGLVYEGNKKIGSATLTQVTIGFQLGGQIYSELILFESEAAMKQFKEGHYSVSAQASAVAAAEGAAAHARYAQGIMIFTLPQNGLMYEASVGGQKLSFKADK